MKCRQCIFFQTAQSKFTLRYNQVAFLCPATGETLTENSEMSCSHFRLLPSDGGQGNDNSIDKA